MKKGSPHAPRPCSPRAALHASGVTPGNPSCHPQHQTRPSPLTPKLSQIQRPAGSAPAPTFGHPIITPTNQETIHARTRVRTVLPVILYNCTTLLLMLPVLCSAVLCCNRAHVRFLCARPRTLRARISHARAFSAHFPADAQAPGCRRYDLCPVQHASLDDTCRILHWEITRYKSYMVNTIGIPFGRRAQAWQRQPCALSRSRLSLHARRQLAWRRRLLVSPALAAHPHHTHGPHTIHGRRCLPRVFPFARPVNNSCTFCARSSHTRASGVHLSMHTPFEAATTATCRTFHGNGNNQQVRNLRGRGRSQSAGGGRRRVRPPR